MDRPNSKVKYLDREIIFSPKILKLVLINNFFSFSSVLKKCDAHLIQPWSVFLKLNFDYITIWAMENFCLFYLEFGLWKQYFLYAFYYEVFIWLWWTLQNISWMPNTDFCWRGGTGISQILTCWYDGGEGDTTLLVS